MLKRSDMTNAERRFARMAGVRLAKFEPFDAGSKIGALSQTADGASRTVFVVASNRAELNRHDGKNYVRRADLRRLAAALRAPADG